MPVIGEPGAVAPTTAHASAANSAPTAPSTTGEVAVPAHTTAPVPIPSSTAGASSTIVGPLGDTRREGAWVVGRSTNVWSGLGDVVLDLRDAVSDTPDLEFTVGSLMGDTTFVVAPGTDVQFRGFAALGDQKVQDLTEEGTPPAPLTRRLTVTTYSLMGDVKVKIVEPGRPVPKWWQRKRR